MNQIKKAILPIAIVLTGIVAARLLIALAKPAKRERPPKKPVAVQLEEMHATSLNAQVEATGVVTPAQKVVLTPQVAGTIVSQSGRLVPGGRFKKGEVLARIDARDYELAVEQERARLQQAELELALEESRGEVARREWKLLGDQRDENEAALALRKPQLATARQALESARSGLKRAELNLARTALRAPFNAVVVSENVDPGQFVSQGSQVATLIGSDQVWVKVAVPVERLSALAIPGTNAPQGQGSPARVVQELGPEQRIVRSGEVVGLAGELDPQTRLAQLLVAIDDPMDPAQGELPLLPGAYVNVGIEGRLLESVFAVPRAAIHDGSHVWVSDPENRLRERTLTVAWRSDEMVYATAGLEAGDRLVTTPLSLPVEGMSVRTVEEAAAEAEARAAESGEAQKGESR